VPNDSCVNLSSSYSWELRAAIRRSLHEVGINSQFLLIDEAI